MRMSNAGSLIQCLSEIWRQYILRILLVRGHTGSVAPPAKTKSCSKFTRRAGAAGLCPCNSTSGLSSLLLRNSAHGCGQRVADRSPRQDKNRTTV
jgi:hypothetical protein